MSQTGSALGLSSTRELAKAGLGPQLDPSPMRQGPSRSALGPLRPPPQCPSLAFTISKVFWCIVQGNITALGSCKPPVLKVYSYFLVGHIAPSARRLVSQLGERGREGLRCRPPRPAQVEREGL